MAVTFTRVPHPNQIGIEGEFLGTKARVYDVTFDSSYATTGEPLMAADLGWDRIYGVIPLSLASNAAGTAAYAVQGRPVSNYEGVNLQLYSATNSVAALPEVVSAVDASTYTVRLVILGS